MDGSERACDPCERVRAGIRGVGTVVGEMAGRRRSNVKFHAGSDDPTVAIVTVSSDHLACGGGGAVLREASALSYEPGLGDGCVCRNGEYLRILPTRVPWLAGRVHGKVGPPSTWSSGAIPHSTRLWFVWWGWGRSTGSRRSS